MRFRMVSDLKLGFPVVFACRSFGTGFADIEDRSLRHYRSRPMNATSFIHVVCWLIQNSNCELDLNNLQQQMTNRLWPSTKIRNQRWKSMIGHLEPKLDSRLVKRSDACNPNWLAFFSLADEVLLSENLTRILVAIVTSKTDCHDVHDIGRDIFSDNINMSNRIWKVSCGCPVALESRSKKFNGLRTLIDHANDLMLSQLPVRSVARSHAVKKETFDEFSRCAGDYQEDVIRQANVALGLAFSDRIQDLSDPTTENEDINQKIIGDVAGLFPLSQRDSIPSQSTVELLNNSTTQLHSVA